MLDGMPSAVLSPPSGSPARRRAAHLLWPLVVWLVTVGNLPLWQRIASLGDGPSWPVMLALAFPVAGVTAALLSLLAWPRVLRPAASVLVVAAALASHFMATYGAVIDPTMLANVVNTDPREVRDLLSWRLLFTVLLVAGPPLWWIWHRPVSPRPFAARLGRNLAGVLAGLLLTVGAGLLGYQQLASLARNHKPVRYMINPLNVVYAAGRLASDQLPQQALAMQPVGLDARLGPSHDGRGAPPLLVIVVGETARAQNWGLNGYARPTTPALARWQAAGDLVNFPDVTSCGTNTQVSVPCMFSPLTRDEGGDQPARHENLLDVLQRAGLAVLWLDNQSGCKGVCDRVPNARPEDMPLPPGLCEGGECPDEALLAHLDARIDALDPARRARGVVLVLHLMGSHGPAYFKRTPAERKPFQPECRQITLSACDPQALLNAYDNTIAYTDHVLDGLLHWLDGRASAGRNDAGLVFVSDHGESLGERGLYLHGVPYAFAPAQQTQVPMVTWLSRGLQARRGVRMDCVRQKAAQPLSHDHLFHTALGLMDVQTQDYRPALDALAPCRP